MNKDHLINTIQTSNIPSEEKQEICRRIKHTADWEQIINIIIEALKLGVDVMSKFPPT